MGVSTLPRQDDIALAVRILQAQRALWPFLDFVILPDPSPGGTGSVKFEKWPYLLQLHAACESVSPGGVLPFTKARKIGASSYFEGRFLWGAIFKATSFYPVISQGEAEAKKIIADCKFIWEHLPGPLQRELVADNATQLRFKGGGTIEAFPATAKAGRSYTGTEILFDEAEFHEDFEASYNALLPLIHDTGGKMFLVTTLDPDKVNSVFRQVYKEQPNRIFFGYFERPGRTEETYAAGLALASDPARFEKENPRTEAEAFAPPRTRAYFDPDSLKALMDDCKEPVEMRQGGLIRIWRKPVVAGKYVAFGDCAWGEKGSYSCLPIADFQTGEQVAEIYGRPTLEEAAQANVELCKHYNDAYVAIEDNGEGAKVAKKMRELGYGHRMYCRTPQHTEASQRSWHTDAGTRPMMLADLEEAVRLRLIVLHCRDAVSEMMTFIRNDQGRPEAAEGAYSDHVMAWAGLWQARKHASWGGAGGAYRMERIV